MEKITEAIDEVEYEDVYGATEALEGVILAISFYVCGILVIGICFGALICGCCIAGAYGINKYCLQQNNTSPDPNSPYKDVAIELKEVTVDLDTSGQQLETTDEVELVGKVA